MLQDTIQALHARILATAAPITLFNVPQLLLPIIALGVQAYAVTLHGTKTFRVALWHIVTALMLRTWLGFRFEAPQFQDFNYALGISAIHLVIKTTELALADRPSPPVHLPGRRHPSRFRQTLNIAINSRHIGLPPNPPLEAYEPPHKRLLSSLYHLKWAAVHCLAFNIIFYGIHAYAPVTLGNPLGGSLKAFGVDMSQAYSQTWLPLVVQTALWEFLAVCTAGMGIFQGMTYLYHAFASAAIGLFGWQPEEWPSFYNKPWAATSLYEFWGKRWHQLFRHQFILLAQGLQTHLHLPPVLLPIIVFSLSGVLHVLGALTANPLPDAWPIFSFFALSGVGCTLELAYRKYRGRRVGGVVGWLWTWTWLGVTGRSVARSWIDSGVLGGTLVWDKMDVVSAVMNLRDEQGKFPYWFPTVAYFVVMIAALAVVDGTRTQPAAGNAKGDTVTKIHTIEPVLHKPEFPLRFAVPDDLSADAGPSHSLRRKALLCFPLLILLALPFWDYTTKIERLPLPVDRIRALAELQMPAITSKVLLTIEDRVYPPNVDRGSLTRALVRDIRLASDGIIHRELRIADNRTWDVITSVPNGESPPPLRIHVYTTAEAHPGFPMRPYLLSEDTKLPNKAGKKQRFKAGTYIVPVHPAHLGDSMFRNHLANAITRPLIALLPTAPAPAPLRALKYSKDVTLSFVVLNEDASNGGFVSSWDIQEALDNFILPHLRPLRPVHNFTIESQVLLHAPLSFSPTWVPHPNSHLTSEDVISEAAAKGGDDHLEAVAEAAAAREVDNGRDGAWKVDGEQIKEFVNSEQWSLDSGSSNNPVLRFLLFVPSASHRPMRLDRSDVAQSFLLPQYGGVAFHNLPRDAPVEAHQLSVAALKPAFHLFVQHLYSLLAMPNLPAPSPFDVDRPFAALSPFQLETLMRIRATENVEEAQKTLAGITRLVDKIEEMKVGEGVRGKVLGAVERLEKILGANGASLRMDSVFELSRDAVTLATEAFFDPSMMGLLYFPTEHKAAVYTPLFAPVAVPIVLFLLKELVAWKKTRTRTAHTAATTT